jgi:hypothetical protein
MFCINLYGWFRFRLKVPHDLTDVVGSTHIQCPLKTKQKRVANKLSLELRDRFIPQFQRLRVELLSGADEAQLHRLAHELLPIRLTTRKTVSGQSTLMLSGLISSYLDDRSKHIDERTLLNTRYVFDLFLWVLGDAPICDLSRRQQEENFGGFADMGMNGKHQLIIGLKDEAVRSVRRRLKPKH